MCNYENVKKYRQRKPWARPREFARRRCVDKKHREYDGYGGRGITFSLAMKEAQILFERDKGHLMTKPSLDREEPDGNYDFDNCRFMELVDNVARARPPGTLKKIKQQTEWED